MKMIINVILFLIMTNNSFAQENADKIIGTWYSSLKDGKVEIYKKDNLYFGKLIELKNSFDNNGLHLIDTNNPDKTKRIRPLIGIEFLTNFKYNSEKNSWKGKLYDYDGTSGNTYDSYMSIKKDGALNIKGFWGLSFFGLNKGLTLTKVK